MYCVFNINKYVHVRIPRSYGTNAVVTQIRNVSPCQLSRNIQIIGDVTSFTILSWCAVRCNGSITYNYCHLQI